MTLTLKLAEEMEMQTTKNKSGRKPAIDDAVIQKICGYIAAGNFFGQACAMANVPVSTAFYWLRKGRQEENAGTIYSDFVEAKEFAEARFEAVHLANINAHSRNDWKASAWMLERKFPHLYGRNRLEIVGDGGGAVKTESTAKVVLYLPDNGRDKPNEQLTNHLGGENEQ